MYSSVDEIVLPVDANGRYALQPGGKYGPDRPAWTYTAPNKPDFYSFNISGVMRLPNGNTLICAGAPGITFEVTHGGRVVWQYNLPSFGAAGRAIGPGAADGRGAVAGPGAAGGRGGGRGAAAGRNVFRAYRYGPDFPGLAGKQLTPDKPLEELVP